MRSLKIPFIKTVVSKYQIILYWVSFQSLSHVQLFVTPWTVAFWAPSNGYVSILEEKAVKLYERCKRSE